MMDCNPTTRCYSRTLNEAFPRTAQYANPITREPPPPPEFDWWIIIACVACVFICQVF
jgi:hypothetical protein